MNAMPEAAVCDESLEQAQREQAEQEQAEPRERVLAAAYDLFTTRGIRDVGIDELIRRAQVAKATFYRHFRAKDDLVLAVLQRRDFAWAAELMAESRRRGAAPDECLLAMFDVLGDWFASRDYEGCTYVRVLLEMGPDHALGQASIVHLARVREQVCALAQEARLREAEAFSRSWHILIKGAIIAAVEGDPDAARRARQMGTLLLEDHRR
jgi:AcrR family transcriptional regulator